MLYRCLVNMDILLLDAHCGVWLKHLVSSYIHYVSCV